VEGKFAYRIICEVCCKDVAALRERIKVVGKGRDEESC